jgi:1-aminocyclopropane-1-carboxylate deaminase/D-cysteine desulfhydrase-like pyridoxal-dependent ACC family enzyme
LNLLPLFKQFPDLKDKLPWISLGTFPTPVIRLKNLGEDLGISRLYLKQDGQSGDIYGGNKVRKLEFILGDAVEKEKKAVLTFGYAGSNHALATSIYANRIGLKSTSILLKQPNARYVGRNLLMGHAHGARLCHYKSQSAAIIPVFLKIFGQTIRHGKFPYIVPPGGSSPIGVLGYVNAAFELKEQVEEGIIPEPDLIFAAVGTMGTAVGLQLGLSAAGLASKVVAVRVTSEKYGNEKMFSELADKTVALVSGMDPSFPRSTIPESEVDMRHDFFGGQYARFSPEGMAAVKLLQDTEGISLEGTYTGKTMAAMVDQVKSGTSKDSVVLFWNTYNSRDFSAIIDEIDYRQLPGAFHQYFEEDFQPLEE